jgi:hypothetical protein
MNISGLINQKLEWLKQADDQQIVQKISTVCFLMGEKVENNRGVNYSKLKIEDIDLNATWNLCGFNTSIGDFNHRLASWVMIGKTCVCRLVYLNDKPEFPIGIKSAELYNDIESEKYIFIPGMWLDDLNAKYDVAMLQVNAQKAESEKERVRRLAAQLLISPKIEV